QHLALINAKTLGVEYELCLDLAVQTLHRGGGDNSFRRAANTHECVDVRARNSSRDTGRKVAVRDKADPRTSCANLFNELLMTAAIEADDRQIVDISAEPAGDVLKVVLNRS